MSSFLRYSSVVVLIVSAALLSGCTDVSEAGPAVTKAVVPGFPALPWQANMNATFRVGVEIDGRGSVTRAHVIAVEGSQNADKAFSIEWLEKVASKWTFQNDNRQSRSATISFVFRLMPRETPAEELLPIFIAPTTVEIRRERRGIVTVY